ncbi:MAG: AsmA protein [Chitinophagales bacterium]|jgi:AsmA protein
MNKLLKILLFVIGAIVTLSVAATIAISLLVDAGTINNEVKAIVKQQTGGNLDIKGGMSWSIYPEISLSLANVSYTNGGEQQPLARLDALKLSVALMPLFSGSVNVSGISLDGMTLNLVVANDGSQNWQQNKPVTSAPATTQQPAAAQTSSASNMSIAIETISITNANINYNDLSTGNSAALSNFSFNSSKANVVGKAFPMTVGFSLKATKPNAAVVVDLTANMAVNAANSTLSLEDLVIYKQVKLDATNGNMNIAANVAGNLSADGVSEVLSITGLTVTANVSGDTTGGETLTISFTGDLSADNKAGKFELSNYQLDAVDLTINGSIKGTKIGDEFSVSGPIAIAEFDLKKLLTTLSQSPPTTINKDALTKVSLSADLNYQGSSAMLQQLTINLDQSNITGFAGLTNIDQQFVVADLTIDSINLDDYMSPTAEPAANDETASASSNTTETPLPLEDLKAINALIKIAINKFVINGLDATNFNLNTRANLGLVELKNLSVDLYNGEIKTTGLLDARPTLATLKAKVNINGVEMKPVLSAVSEVDWLNGKTNLNANITTKGNTVEAWQRGLNGSANFAMTNLLAEGISIDKQLCQSIALIKGKTLSNQWSENTALDNLNGKIRFINGTMQNDSLTGGSSTIKLTGNGWLSPEKNKMNYKLGVQITGDQISQDPACEVNKRYRDISWPLQCKGQLDTEPKNLCGIDQSKMKDIVKDLTVDEVGRKASNELDKYLKDKNLEGVGDLLKGLFK